MTDRKLTDEEIIYAFERCAEKACAVCPVKLACDVDIHFIVKCILDVIKRQQAVPLRTYITTAKAEVIKEFAERLKAGLIEGGIYPVLVKNQIEKVVKDMTGEAYTPDCLESVRHLSGSERDVYLLGEWGKDEQH